MINVIIPIVEKKYKYNDILSDLANLGEVKVFIGVKEELYNTIAEFAEAENFHVTQFSDYKCTSNSCRIGVDFDNATTN